MLGDAGNGRAQTHGMPFYRKRVSNMEEQNLWTTGVQELAIALGVDRGIECIVCIHETTLDQSGKKTGHPARDRWNGKPANGNSRCLTLLGVALQQPGTHDQRTAHSARLGNRCARLVPATAPSIVVSKPKPQPSADMISGPCHEQIVACPRLPNKSVFVGRW